MNLFIFNASRERFIKAFIVFVCLFFSSTVFGYYQSWEWAKGFGGGNVTAATVDPSGNVFVAGSFSGDSVTFGSTVLLSTGANNLFLAKYDSSGNVIWAKAVACKTGDVINSAKADPFGNVYIAGQFDIDSISFGAVTLINDTSNYSARNLF